MACKPGFCRADDFIFDPVRWGWQPAADAASASFAFCGSPGAANSFPAARGTLEERTLRGESAPTTLHIAHSHARHRGYRTQGPVQHCPGLPRPHNFERAYPRGGKRRLGRKTSLGVLYGVPPPTLTFWLLSTIGLRLRKACRSNVVRPKSATRSSYTRAPILDESLYRRLT